MTCDIRAGSEDVDSLGLELSVLPSCLFSFYVSVCEMPTLWCEFKHAITDIISMLIMKRNCTCTVYHGRYGTALMCMYCVHVLMCRFWETWCTVLTLATPLSPWQCIGSGQSASWRSFFSRETRSVSVGWRSAPCVINTPHPWKRVR